MALILGLCWAEGSRAGFLTSVGSDSGEIQPRIQRLAEPFVQDEIIVRYKGSRKAFDTVKVTQGRVAEEIKEYLKRSDIEYAEPNYIAYAQMTPNDPYFSYQWNMKNPLYGGIDMEKAWDVTAGSNSTIVAVVDTGIAYETYGNFCKAPDLAQTCFVPGYNFVGGTSHANDDNGHGTHVAGTIAQSTNNNLGTAGIAFNSCLMPVKALNSSGSGTYANIANGIRWAADHGAKVINLSLGGSATNTTLQSAVKYAYDKGATIVAACGNDNAGSCLYPAAYDDYVIAVSATQYNKTKAPYSNYGSSVDVAAPGGNTGVDLNGDGYGDGILQQTIASSSKTCTFGYYFYQGTSMATPHVAGIAALLYSNGNAATPGQIRNILQSTAEDLGTPGRDNIYGYGLVNAYAALQSNAQPACSSDGQCDDSNACTADTCQNAGTVNAQCTHSTLSDNTACGAGICCAGLCSAPVCSADAACSDSNACTTDTCQSPGTCAASCAFTPKTQCAGGDGCCPAGCAYANDTDCAQGTICWKASYAYLSASSNQAKKFCKCAQGTYGYRTYRRTSGIKTVYKYTNTSNNTVWTTSAGTATSYLNGVTCTDGRLYPTTVDYTYPK